MRTLATTLAILACVQQSAVAADRTFDFRYAFAVTGLKPGQTARVWIPEATSDAAQDVGVAATELPADAIVTSDASSLNRTFYVKATAGADGTIPLSITYHVTRREITSLPMRAGENVAADLKADRLVPIGGKPGKLLDGNPLPADDRAKARALYDFIFDYMTYSKDKPGWGRGDVEWACDSRFGNCSDFHSLFLSLCRTTNLPAKMEFGFIVPAVGQPAASGKFNYHCWAYFKPAAEDAWVPVDISKAKNRPDQKDAFFAHLDADRVGFSTGRDLTLAPPQDGPPVNFLVYPYVEVDGQPWPEANVVRSMSFTPGVSSTTQPAAK